MDRPTVSVRVWGDYACFSRPEFKVERVSYPIITPSAARGVLEAIFWKPEMRYEIRRIGVLKEAGSTVILRNELSDRQGRTPIVVEEKRQQRSSLVLKNVDYIIEADVVLRLHATDPVAKYNDQIRRRVERGQYHHAPYLGTREFSASFAPVNGHQPTSFDRELGPLLFDLAFVPSQRRAEMSFRMPERAEVVTGYAQALFLPNATITGGWLNVPRDRYAELYRLESGDV